MRDFLFYGSDVRYFRSALHGYRGYLVTHSKIEYPNAIDDVHEMIITGFSGDRFKFYYENVQLVIRSLEWYANLIANKMRTCNDMDVSAGYCNIAAHVRTLIAEINLMLDCNDDD